MSGRSVVTACLWAALCAPAWAGQTACRVQDGVLLVPARLAGVPGEYVLDAGTAHTQLHDTRAQGAGLAETAFIAPLQLAGRRTMNVPVQVADLDARTRRLPVPPAGVIGSDVLSRYVVDLSFAPCRIRLRDAGAAPPLRGATTLPMRLQAGLTVVPAAISDGAASRSGWFAVDTGSDVAVRLASAKAVDAAGAAAKPAPLAPYGTGRASLRALSLGGDLFENLPAGLAEPDLDPDVAGRLGLPVWGRYRLRLDYPNGRLLIAPAVAPR